MDEDSVMHGSLPPSNELNDSLLCTCAGRYSVSKINIVIGQLLMFVWGILYLVTSITFYLVKIPIIWDDNQLIISSCFASVFILLLIIPYIVLFYKKQ